MDLQTLVEMDRQVLGVFNGAHNMFLDTLMVTLTTGVTWVPLYIALLYMVVKNKETMAQVTLMVVCCALCLMITELVTEGYVKPLVARPRPGSDPEWMNMVHVVNGRRGSDYSFFSAHAANTSGIAVFLPGRCATRCSRGLWWGGLLSIAIHGSISLCIILSTFLWALLSAPL